MSKIFPAATVVPVRDGKDGLEVLMLRRSDAVSFAGGWVFPGGRIDRGDYRDERKDVETAARRGAVRESMEEAQLAIEESDLVYFAHWTTPPNHPKRFATWFFIAQVHGDTEAVVVDGSEIVEHRWYRPAQALVEHHALRLEMLPPTVVTLNELQSCDSIAQALAMYRTRPVPVFEPRRVQTEKGIAILYVGDAGYERADPDAEGPRHRCWLLDNAWHYEKLP